jgi:hypothetical protein
MRMPRKPPAPPAPKPKKAVTAHSKPAPASSRQADAVTALLDAADHPQRAVIDAMRTLIARAVPSASESIKWNAPSFALAAHFATFHLRAKSGVHLVLHLGAKPLRALDMREALGVEAPFLDWKGPDRAVVTVRDATHLTTLQPALTRVLRAWATHVG